MRGRNSVEWKWVAKVIKSIDDLKQVECAKNLIAQYKKIGGEDHKLLELELKFKVKSLK